MHGQKRHIQSAMSTAIAYTYPSWGSGGVMRTSLPELGQQAFWYIMGPTHHQRQKTHPNVHNNTRARETVLPSWQMSHLHCNLQPRPKMFCASQPDQVHGSDRRVVWVLWCKSSMLSPSARSRGTAWSPCISVEPLEEVKSTGHTPPQGAKG